MRRPAETVAPPPAHPGPSGHHTCRECPVCGTEECRIMAELGMACETAQAAQEARFEELAAARKGSRPVAARRR